MASFVYDCPLCSNIGCKHCDDIGTFELTECPKKAIPQDIWEFLDYAELYEKGIAPEPGGALDQLHSFNVYARFVWNEKATIKAQAGIGLIDG